MPSTCRSALGLFGLGALSTTLAGLRPHDEHPRPRRDRRPQG